MKIRVTYSDNTTGEFGPIGHEQVAYQILAILIGKEHVKSAVIETPRVALG